MDYYEDEEYQKAQTLLELIISSYRGKKEAEEIYYKYSFTFIIWGIILQPPATSKISPRLTEIVP
jgi:hypothetical protein